MSSPRLFGALELTPADVAMSMAKGEIYPEDASALRTSNYNDWAAVADQHRESSWSAPGKPRVNGSKQLSKSN